MKLKIRENLTTASLNPKFTGSYKKLNLIKMKDELSRSRLYAQVKKTEPKKQGWQLHRIARFFFRKHRI